jgi:hypothetical protein
MRAGCAVLRQLATERALVILVILVGVGPASITVPMDASAAILSLVP